MEVSRLPKCVNGAIDTTLLNGSTNVLLFQQDFYVVNLQPRTAYIYERQGTLTKQVRINACGIGRVARTDRFKIQGEMRIGNRQYNVNGYRIADNPVCRGSVLYVPPQNPNGAFFPPTQEPDFNPDPNPPDEEGG